MLSCSIPLLIILALILCCACEVAATLEKPIRSSREHRTLSASRSGDEKWHLGSSLRLGLTWEHCEKAGDCQPPRKCASEVKDGELILCADEIDCECVPEKELTLCTETAACDKGEVCVGSADWNSTFCVSENTASDFSDTVKHAGKNLTFEDCKTNDDCEDPRECRVIGGAATILCTDQDDCFCRPVRMQRCDTPGDCPYAETCITNDDGADFCISKDIQKKNPTAYKEVKGWGLAMDVCDNSQDCQFTKCRYYQSTAWRLCLGRPNCFCRNEELDECTTNADCEKEGEVCSIWEEEDTAYCRSERYVDNTVDVSEVTPSPKPTKEPSRTPAPTGSNAPAPGVTPSTSPFASNTPVDGEPIGNGICFDADALSEFEAKDLVYSSHRTARVLCDKNGSCATPGHLVSYEGTSMMMKTYCGTNGCYERVMKVNSPRYRKGLLVEAKTKGLYFTTFAARYETRVEELVLTSFIRVGL